MLPRLHFYGFYDEKTKKKIFSKICTFSVKLHWLNLKIKLINSQLIMAPLTKKELRITIANFYKLHHPKGKFFTYSNFKQPIKDKIITKKTHKKNQKMRNRNGTSLHY